MREVILSFLWSSTFRSHQLCQQKMLKYVRRRNKKTNVDKNDRTQQQGYQMYKDTHVSISNEIRSPKTNIEIQFLPKKFHFITKLTIKEKVKILHTKQMHDDATQST